MLFFFLISFFPHNFSHLLFHLLSDRLLSLRFRLLFFVSPEIFREPRSKLTYFLEFCLSILCISSCSQLKFKYTFRLIILANMFEMVDFTLNNCPTVINTVPNSRPFLCDLHVRYYTLHIIASFIIIFMRLIIKKESMTIYI